MKLTALILLLSLTSVPIFASETEAERKITLLEAKVASVERKVDYIANELVEKFGIYLVQPGDTLHSIAQRLGTSVNQLRTWNPQLTDPTKIQPALLIRIRACE